MDPEHTDAQAKAQAKAQAEALLATRRILARLKVGLLESGEELAVRPTEEDRELLAHDTEFRAEDDLRVFDEWHAALGTDPQTALLQMGQRLRRGPPGANSRRSSKPALDVPFRPRSGYRPRTRSPGATSPELLS